MPAPATKSQPAQRTSEDESAESVTSVRLLPPLPIPARTLAFKLPGRSFHLRIRRSRLSDRPRRRGASSGMRLSKQRTLRQAAPEANLLTLSTFRRSAS
jgi:hypothetical protein